MCEISLLSKQIIETQSWVDKFVSGIPLEKWGIIPQVVETNVAWQIGHLTLSQYYYAIFLICGPRNDVAEKIPLKKYSHFFARGNQPKNFFSELPAKDLVTNWEVIKQETIVVLNSLIVEDLASPIFNTQKPHPFVRTKSDALSWNIQHTMMHCGQIAMLKRIIDVPFDYGM